MSDLDKLVQLHRNDRATLILGSYGSGKEQLAFKALEAMGKKPHVVHLDLCTEFDLDTALKYHNPNDGFVFANFDNVKYEFRMLFASKMIKPIRVYNHSSFITAHPAHLEPTGLYPLIGSIAYTDLGKITKVVELMA